MKLLVTGGAGFIGSALIRQLITTTNHTVINIDKLTYAGNLANLVSVADNKRYYFEQVDITNQVEIKRIFLHYQPDAIIHLAAESHVDRSIQAADDFIHSNIIGTFILLEEAKNYWLNLATNKQFRFLHISTDEVFGDLADETNYFTETAPYNPSSPYSASKASADHLVRAWHRTYGLPIIITTSSNNYGPYQFPEKLIPLTIINALQEKDIPIYGNGKQIRQWLFVEDHVQALYQVLTKGIIGETYNIAANNQLQNIEVVKMITDILDELTPSKNLASYQQLITFTEDRAGHDSRYALNSSKIQQQLQWQAGETFASGLKKTVIWYLNHANWYQNIVDTLKNNLRSIENVSQD